MRVWVWGGSSGVGAEIARQCAERGDQVLCLARRAAETSSVQSVPFDLNRPGEELRERLRRLFVAEGLTDLESDERQHILDRGYRLGFRRYWHATRVGGPDLAIISSGMGAYLRADLWRDNGERGHAGIVDLIRVDLTSRMWLINELTMAMRRRRSGRIVVIGSLMAKRGRGDHAAGVYASAMRGIEAFLDCEVKSCARRGIALGLVRLGWTETPMTAGIVEWKKRAIEKRLGPMISATRAAAEIIAYADRIKPQDAIEFAEVGR